MMTDILLKLQVECYCATATVFIVKGAYVTLLTNDDCFEESLKEVSGLKFNRKSVSPNCMPATKLLVLRLFSDISVSYTHLTLPTIYSV